MLILFLLFALTSFTSLTAKAVPEDTHRFILDMDLRQEQLVSSALTERDLEFSLTRIAPGTSFYRLILPAIEDERIYQEMLDNFVRDGYLHYWQKDHPVEVRNAPNDPLWQEQWNLEIIGMLEAWTQVLGGITFNSDTIVVAILDTGFDIVHEDLAGNIWVNRGEIPGNGIDDDQNGYIDDYFGLNIGTKDDEHVRDKHGTGVAGIIGARGNNGKGIAGINWNIRLMLLSNVKTESDIIEGYEYVRAFRRKYIETGGAEGAFVVAVNLSAGIDNAMAADHPLWCQQYELLGEAGILGVCATTNRNTNVDEAGDMPTTCPSNYLIAVTNTGRDDRKLMFAGYGATHIDLGAPGTTAISTVLSNDYGDFDGTSAAAPHITGAIALMYAAACPEILDIAFTDPGTLALNFRNILLANTDPNASLQGITVSGGRLNVANAVHAVLEVCGNDGGTFEIISLAPNPSTTDVTVTVSLPDAIRTPLRVFDAGGRLVHEEDVRPISAGQQTVTFRTGHLVPGVYYVSLMRGKMVSTKALMVQ